MWNFPGQRLFYVSLAAILLVSSLMAYESEGILTGGDPVEVTQEYYFHHLHYLKAAVKPRPIRYIDSSNIKKHRKVAVEGILFTHYAPDARRVDWISSRNQFRPEPMMRNKMGVWYFIYVPRNYEGSPPTTEITYKLSVDGLFTTDATHEQQKPDGLNGFLSVYHMEKDIPRYGVMALQSKPGHTKAVLFRFKAPEAHTVHLVGSFNGWLNDVDELAREPDGSFRLVKHLSNGTHYFFYIVDGGRRIDPVAGPAKNHSAFGRVTELVVSK